MSGTAKVFLVLGLFYIADFFYKIFTRPSCNGNYFGFDVPAIADFVIKAFFAFVLIKPGYEEWQKKKVKS
ncbi:MAG: hypothetical protein AB8G86_15110 [Saprospiraceae bacterium]